LVIDLSSWRMPFIIVVGISLIGFIFGAIFIKSYNTTKDTKLDKRSVIYSTFGFGLMLYAFSSAGNLGFDSLIVIVSLLVSLFIISYNMTQYTIFEYRSVIYLLFRFGLMLYAFSSDGNLGFDSPIVIVSLLVSLFIILVFIKRQLQVPNPLLNLIVFKNRVF